MGELVNLRLARKRKLRAEDARQADENRALHGRNKAERQALDRSAQSGARFLDGHRREPGDPSGK